MDHIEAVCRKNNADRNKKNYTKVENVKMINQSCRHNNMIRLKFGKTIFVFLIFKFMLLINYLKQVYISAAIFQRKYIFHVKELETTFSFKQQT